MKYHLLNFQQGNYALLPGIVVNFKTKAIGLVWFNWMLFIELK